MLKSIALIIVSVMNLATTPQTPAKISSPVVETSMSKSELGDLQEKQVHFPNGDHYWSKRIDFTASSAKRFRFTWVIEGKNGTFRYLDRQQGKAAWKTIPLQNPLPKATGFITTDKTSTILSSPAFYREQTHETIYDLSSQASPVSVQETKHGYALTYSYPIEKQTTAEVWALQSPATLIDWKQPDLNVIWSGLDMHENQKWLAKGFYVKSPSTYRPTGKNVYWRIPDNYLAASFIKTGGSRAADDLGWVMLQTALSAQTKAGYWKSGPCSTWLLNDYNIGCGFYDTRFNTDLAELLLRGYQKYQERQFLQATLTYSHYLFKHIDQEKIVIKQGDRQGWLVPDYGYEGKHKQSNASLNHMLQEVNYLYRLYLQTQEEKCKLYAERILEGIRLLGTKWIRSDGNLHYAYLPDGKIGMQDYPYLTYNDLLETQSLLQRVYGQKDPVLQRLMDAKKKWMDAHGVTGYRVQESKNDVAVDVDH
ncbi:hypothetical protein [Brevibacillus fulvus]|uniref:D-glucuronyl C5-epimerase C-terminal domain-containing protein n=1 Tax=Brevibacillus fulvus TaxID=1125967 RepID=A0A938XWV0_9BACL|nr:hypothetical protein [Brevibacillus fulvus]MBM7589123.1 hypothetical protein [Brevibacillus fulvus]